MSINVMTIVWGETETSGSERLVLLALADNANDQGVCFPSMATIARKCNMSRRYVIMLLEKLEERGYIKRQHRQKDTGDRNSNVYQIIPDNFVCNESVDDAEVVNHSSPPNEEEIITGGEQEITRVVNPSSLGGEQEITRGSEPQFTRVVNHSSHKPSVNRHIEPSINHTSLILEEWKRLFSNKRQPKAKTLSKKIDTRMKDIQFQDKWREALGRAARSPTLQSETWFQLEFFVRNDENWQKCLDGWMDWKDKENGSKHKKQKQRPVQTEEQIQATAQRLSAAKAKRLREASIT